ncbi:hypothetical protein LguiB_005875 [Lonicera macranthoides]
MVCHSFKKQLDKHINLGSDGVWNSFQFVEIFCLLLSTSSGIRAGFLTCDNCESMAGRGNNTERNNEKLETTQRTTSSSGVTREDLETLQQQQRQHQIQITQLCARLEQSGLLSPQDQNMEPQRCPPLNMYQRRNVRNQPVFEANQQQAVDDSSDEEGILPIGRPPLLNKAIDHNQDARLKVEISNFTGEE